MSITTEHVKNLRKLASTTNDEEIKKALYNAATTIEVLSEKLHNKNMQSSSIHYHGGWIPVDERMPNDTSDVLITYQGTICGGTHDGEFFTSTGVGSYYNSRKRWTLKSTIATEENGIEILAWKPLPEPYKEAE